MSPRALAAVVVIALFAPVAALLAWPVGTGLTEALEGPTADREAMPLEVGFPSRGPETRTGGMPLTVDTAAWLRHLDAVTFLTATYDTAPVLEAARFDAGDGSCEFRAEPGTGLPNNGLLVLRKVHCNPTPATRDFMLWLRVSGAGRAAVWTYAGADADDPLFIAGGDGARFAVRGERRIDPSEATVRRVDLIAHFWQRDAPTIWFWMLLVVLFATGGAGLLASRTAAATAPRAGLHVSAGAAALALSLSAAWSILMPPLQGADEPDHLLSYAEVVGAPQVESNLEWLARRTHFERLRFRGDRRFRAADIDRPYDPAWTGDIHSERMDRRSAAAPAFWRLSASLGARDLPLPDLLLAVRMANAVLFGLAAGLAAWFVWWGAGGRGALWRLGGLAAIPTLPYFAAMVSDWALVASWSVLFAAGLLVLVRDGARAAWGSLLVGLATALLLATSVSGLLVLPLFAAVVAGRIVLGGPQPLVFWGGLGAGAMLTAAMTRDLFVAGFARYDAQAGSSAELLAQVNRVVGGVADAPWLLLLPVAAGLCAELLWHAVGGGRLTGRMAALGPPAMTGLAMVASILLAGSLVVDWPTLALLDEGVYTSAGAYAAAVVSAFATLPRLRGFDHLTFTSFMSGFGWIDTILPGLMLGAVCVAVTASLWAARRAPARELAWVLVGLAGLMTTMAAAGLAAYLMQRNLHGRYVLTAGVAGMALVLSLAGARLATAPRSSAAIALIGLALLHGLSLTIVLTRYL